MGRGGTLTLSPPSSLQTRLKRARMGTRHRPGLPEYSESHITRTGARLLPRSPERIPSRRGFFILYFFFSGGLHRRESFRAISTARLRTSLPVHLPPIYVVVFNGPHARSYLVAGFALRCFQRLSVPDAATQLCPGRDNWRTGGRSNTVLSY